MLSNGGKILNLKSKEINEITLDPLYSNYVHDTNTASVLTIKRSKK
jgi:hypothetical protein